MNKIKTYALGLLTAATFAVSAYSCNNGIEINAEMDQRVETQKNNTVRDVNQYESIDQTVLVGDTIGTVEADNKQTVLTEKKDTVYNILQVRRTNQGIE